MTITLRSGKEVQVKKEVEKKQNNDEAEKEYQNQAGGEKKQNIIELKDESVQLKVQIELSTDDTMQKKEEVGVYQPVKPQFPRVPLTTVNLRKPVCLIS